MSRRTADTLVGALVVGVIGALVFALSRTQGWNERFIDVYMVTESAQDLNVDTKVFLQGLEVGRVRRVVPRADTTLMQQLQFVATLRIRQRFAEVVPRTFPSGVDISLRLPEHPYGVLQAGDTIQGVRLITALDRLARIADTLRDQVKLVLEDTRSLVQKVTHTAEITNNELAQTGPEMRRTMDDLRATLDKLRPALEQATALMTSADRQLGTVGDSLTTTLSAARRALAGVDSLTHVARDVANENQADVRTTVTNLLVISTKLEHFLDQVSRRPLRMITGVRPLPAESLPRKP